MYPFKRVYLVTAAAEMMADFLIYEQDGLKRVLAYPNIPMIARYFRQEALGDGMCLMINHGTLYDEGGFITYLAQVIRETDKPPHHFHWALAVSGGPNIGLFRDVDRNYLALLLGLSSAKVNQIFSQALA